MGIQASPTCISSAACEAGSLIIYDRQRIVDVSQSERHQFLGVVIDDASELHHFLGVNP
tara:strand:+ start:275 stop:451 length:177 start_codon:yes stop_codon:yes gene_type:complete